MEPFTNVSALSLPRSCSIMLKPPNKKEAFATRFELDLEHYTHKKRNYTQVANPPPLFHWLTNYPLPLQAIFLTILYPDFNTHMNFQTVTTQILKLKSILPKAPLEENQQNSHLNSFFFVVNIASKALPRRPGGPSSPWETSCLVT
jgi:hypothetical protein